MAKKTSKPKILIVDDDPHMVKLFNTLLTRGGYEVVEANYGLPAMFRAVRTPPDLIIADLHMPIMNGLELIDQFKGHRDTRHIPIVVVSGSDSMEDRKAAFKAGCAGYIAKPVDSKTFLVQIAKFLKAKKRK
jgi:CheY-like chemotaxis protein